tara:strand:+ start:3272 stop:3457 length:186 start_codon:yes stop_codon:yes gene_type:complete
MFDESQYSGNPDGSERVKNPNITGSIHNIILFVDACRGSAAAGVLIFCMTHIEAPTKTAIM